MEKIKKYFPILIVLILAFWSITPLFESGFFPIHDDTQVVRVEQMHKSLEDGLFPVRWVADLGYGFGYPIFNFYAPLAYYVGALFMFLGFDALIATKIMIGIGTLLAGVSMYLLARAFWGRVGGILSAILYVYAPYHALNIYVRGAIAELWAYAFIPLVFLGIYKVFQSIKDYLELISNSKLKNSSFAKASADKQKSKLQIKIKKSIWNWVCLTSLSYAAIILSHNLTAMMVTPYLIVFAAYFYIKLRKSDRIYKPYFVFLGMLIGILISAFYWLPVPFEIKYTNVLSVVGGGSDFRDHFVCAAQLWNSQWGFAGSAPGCIDGFSLKIGKLHIILSAISIFWLFLKRKLDVRFYALFMFSVFYVLSIFMTLKESRFIWEAFPQMAFFQFPWRFLSMIVFFASLLAGGSLEILDKFKNNNNIRFIKFFGVLILTAGVLFLEAKLFMPQRYLDSSVKDYTKLETILWDKSKISDEYMPEGFLKPIHKYSVAREKFVKNKDVRVISYFEKTGYIRAELDVLRPTRLKLNIAYFPAWHIFINGNQAWFGYSSEGMIVDLRQGRQTIEIGFTQTPIEKIGNFISIAGIILLLTGIIRHRKK